MPATDPTEQNRRRPLWLLLRRLDDEIVQAYIDAGIPGFRSRSRCRMCASPGWGH